MDKIIDTYTRGIGDERTSLAYTILYDINRHSNNQMEAYFVSYLQP